MQSRPQVHQQGKKDAKFVLLPDWEPFARENVGHWYIDVHRIHVTRGFCEHEKSAIGTACVFEMRRGALRQQMEQALEARIPASARSLFRMFPRHPRINGLGFQTLVSLGARPASMLQRRISWKSHVWPDSRRCVVALCNGSPE